MIVAIMMIVAMVHCREGSSDGYFVSTAHVATKSSGTVTIFRHRPSGEKLEIPLLDDYVKYMRGVDRGDSVHVRWIDSKPELSHLPMAVTLFTKGRKQHLITDIRPIL